MEDGIQLINEICLEEFVNILQQVVVHESVEVEKYLQGSINFDSNDLHLLLETIIYVWKQSFEIIIKPTVLHKHLVKDLKFDMNKADEFVKAWTDKTNDDFQNLDKLLKLNNIFWEFNLQTSSSSITRQLVPILRLKLELTNKQGVNIKNLNFTINKEQVQQLHVEFENIQNKLDCMRKDASM